MSPSSTVTAMRPQEKLFRTAAVAHAQPNRRSTCHPNHSNRFHVTLQLHHEDRGIRTSHLTPWDIQQGSRHPMSALFNLCHTSHAGLSTPRWVSAALGRPAPFVFPRYTAMMLDSGPEPITC
ncbi:unnamed protein product [Periconia digitata]|uniref:Uncharacterized protein n=1 Tax=Periconia digitata TaxID=1303443 RepID=A0A9W4UV09_9PLEO|nr:unnamed protein product [Periconia digitata]